MLELLLAEHRLAGAYEILERFDWQGRKPAPAQIYRALSFLEGMGLVHHVASRNAYVACCWQEEAHGSALLICDGCGLVAEPTADGLRRTVQELAGQSGFKVTSPVLEVIGRCPECLETADT